VSKKEWVVQGFRGEQLPLSPEQVQILKDKMAEKFDVEEWIAHRARIREATDFFDACRKEARRIMQEEFGLSKHKSKHVHVNGHTWEYMEANSKPL